VTQSGDAAISESDPKLKSLIHQPPESRGTATAALALCVQRIGDRAMKNLMMDGVIKLILLLFMAARLISSSNAASHSNQEPSCAPDLPQHDSGNLPPPGN
jgi:hypothetical protein